MSEKRQFVRHPSSIPIEVRLLTGDRESVCVSDVSLSGLAFTFHWPIAIGVMVEVQVPRLTEHIGIAGRVVRCSGKGMEWMIGIVFEDRREVFRMRMVQQICHIEDYRKKVMEIEGRSISSDAAAAEWIAMSAASFPHCGL